jgi:hypothetical protein
LSRYVNSHVIPGLETARSIINIELVSKLFKLLLSMVYYGVSWA